MLGFKIEAGQTEKTTTLRNDVMENDEARGFSDDVEQIAMLARRGISPFACGPPAGARSTEANEHGSPGRVANVADSPVAADTSSIREIVAAHAFSLLGKAAREIRYLRGHGRAPRRRRPAVAGGPEGWALLLLLLGRDSVRL